MEDKDLIIAINLKYSSGSRSLKLIAFEQLVIKALFWEGKSLNENDIATKLKKLLGNHKIDQQTINEAIETLQLDRKIVFNEGLWSLDKEFRDEIEDQVTQEKILLKNILREHFPKNIDFKTLESWFLMAVVDFFGYYGDDWVNSLCRNVIKTLPRVKTINELLEKSIKNFNLEKYKEPLNKGFYNFLESENSNDKQMIFNLALAMFSAKLVAADISVDPITVDEIKNSKILVDTNILFSINLNSPRNREKFVALGHALKHINAQIYYLFETKEEYSRVCFGRRAEIVGLLRGYGLEVLEGADKNDVLQTAINYGCKNEEDFDRFFESIAEPPKNMGDDLKIELLDDRRFIKIKDTAEKDNKMKNKIQQLCKKLRPPWEKKEKSQAALNHDVVLLHSLRNLRDSGENCWILTFDRTLLAYEIEDIGNYDIPRVFSLETLIQLLALNNAGPEFRPEDYASLFANMLLEKCTPLENTYSLVYCSVAF